jgi:hypothetical protein
MKLTFIACPEWPPLAWLAKCSESEVAVTHGSQVEISADWFAEAVWAGPFGAGEIDHTDLIFGSGGRLREGCVVFVSSGSTLDRLVAYQGTVTYVSNSLVALLATLDARVDPAYPQYYTDFRSITKGVDEYKPFLSTSSGPVRLIYFRNLEWDGCSLQVTEKPGRDRSFNGFEDYAGFMKQSLAEIGRNMHDGARRHAYRPLGTLSSGYDSPTVATLARGLDSSFEALSFQSARGGAADSGQEIAKCLGLTVIPLDRTAWRAEPLSEVPFIAADAYGSEMHYSAARGLLERRILLTGYHGDKVWDADKHDLTPQIKRGDPTGLSLTEWRLSAGFIHCPVPFFAVRNVDQIYSISTSPEMKAWSVGGDYDRPICRRILESAGVPRGLFAKAKSAASIVLWNPQENFLPPESMSSYRAWLRRHQLEWLRKGQLPPAWKVLKHKFGSTVRRSKASEGVIVASYFTSLFPWALELALKRYRQQAGVARAAGQSAPGR